MFMSKSKSGTTAMLRIVLGTVHTVERPLQRCGKMVAADK